MSPTARTVHVFGLYLVAVGLIVTSVPNVLFGVLGIPATDEPWIRVLGVVTLVVAAYFFVAARSELTPFFRATVPGRVVLGGALIVVAVVWGYWAAVVFGLTDFAGAVWTQVALRRDTAVARSASPARDRAAR